MLHVSHNVTNYEFFYEPFYVSLDSVPRYDERFVGYGFTRNTQVKTERIFLVELSTILRKISQCLSPAGVRASAGWVAVLRPLPALLRPLGAEQDQEGAAELAGETELQQPPQVPPLQEGGVRQVSCDWWIHNADL